jgi:RNA polymerase sigma factor (sigma-70 family)
VELIKAAPSFRGDSKVSTWAIAIARRCMFSWVRQLSWRRKYETFGELDLFVADGSRDATAMIAMRTALARISERKRAAFFAMAIYELTAEEAGTALGVPSNTAASRYRAAREEIGAMLHEPLVRPAIRGAS